MKEMCGIEQPGLPPRAGGHYPRSMPNVRRFACACALLLAAMLLAFSAGAASAAPSLDIYADWADNGVIDGHYSFADLQSALQAAQGDVRYAKDAFEGLRLMDTVMSGDTERTDAEAAKMAERKERRERSQQDADRQRTEHRESDDSRPQEDGDERHQ